MSYVYIREVYRYIRDIMGYPPQNIPKDQGAPQHIVLTVDDYQQLEAYHETDARPESIGEEHRHDDIRHGDEEP